MIEKPGWLVKFIRNLPLVLTLGLAGWLLVSWVIYSRQNVYYRQTHKIITIGQTIDDLTVKIEYPSRLLMGNEIETLRIDVGLALQSASLITSTATFSITQEPVVTLTSVPVLSLTPNPTTTIPISTTLTMTQAVTLGNMNISFPEPVRVMDVITSTLNTKVSANSLSANIIFYDNEQTTARILIPIQNNGVLSRTESISMPVTVTLAGQLPITHTIVLEIEGYEDGTPRQLITGVIEEQSPIILGIGAAAALFFKLLDMQEKDRERQDAKRRADEEQAKDQQKQEEEKNKLANKTQEKLNDLRKAFRLQHQEDIWLDWNVITEKFLSHVPAQVKNLIPELLKVINGKQALTKEFLSEKTLVNGWEQEVAAALLIGYQKVEHGTNLARRYAIALEYCRLYILEEPLVTTIDQALIVFKQSGLLQDWRKKLVFQDNPSISVLTRHFQRRLEKNPFPYLYAEEEKETLFDKSALYVGEPISSFYIAQKKLQEQSGNWCITGPTGSGRSVLAHLVLAKEDAFSPKKLKKFSVLINHPLTIEAIRYQMAGELFEYLSYKPTLLVSESMYSLKLLASLLVHIWPHTVLLSKLSEAIKCRAWEKEVEEGNSDQKKLWGEIAENSLVNLRELVNETKLDIHSLSDWFVAYVQCVRIFDFNQVRLMFDITGDQGKWFQKTIAPYLPDWQSYGIEVVVLATQASTLHETVKTYSYFYQCSIEWSKEDLIRLFVHRLTQINKVSEPASIFGVNAYQAFQVNVGSTPRSMIRLWQACLKEMDPDDEFITLEIVNRACQAL